MASGSTMEAALETLRGLLRSRHAVSGSFRLEWESSTTGAKRPVLSLRLDASRNLSLSYVDLRRPLCDFTPPTREEPSYRSCPEDQELVRQLLLQLSRVYGVKIEGSPSPILTLKSVRDSLSELSAIFPSSSTSSTPTIPSS